MWHSVRGAVLLTLLSSLVVAPARSAPKQVQVTLGSENLSGLFWEPKRSLSPGVLLLPMLGHGKEDWVPLAERLRGEGYGVLALDFREQGRTDRERLLADVRAGFTFLREQKKIDAARIALAGASLGANAALNYAAEEPMVQVAVLLSPGASTGPLTSEAALRDYGMRPLMLLAAEEDLASAPAVHRLAEAAQGRVVLKVYPGAAHGTDLLGAGLAAEQDILSFLQAYL